MTTEPRPATVRRGRALSALFLLFTLVLIGCATQGPPIRSYLLQNGRQYFVRPVRLRGDHGTVLMDFTVRITEDAEGDRSRSVSANFTAPLVDGSREIESPRFSVLSGETLPLRELRFLFVGDGTVRYESSMEYEEFARLVKESSGEEKLILLELRRNGVVERYRARGEFYEAMKQLELRLE